MPEATSAGRSEAIDAMKGIAIIGVLVLHTLPYQMLWDSMAVFHIWQAVPVFLVLMGYTGVLTRVTPLWDYARRRARRLLVPLSIIWLVSAVISLIKEEFIWSPMYLVGKLPAGGGGNYFIGIVLVFALALPILRRFFDASPRVFVVCCLALSASHELLVAQLSYDGYLHSTSIFRVLFCISLGMLLASGHRVSRWLPPLLLVSVPYLIAIALRYRVPFMVVPWQSQAFFASAYPAAMVWLGLRLRWPSCLSAVGRASFHIFLIQILWFGQLVSLESLSLPMRVVLRVVAVPACIAIGWAFMRLEGRLLPSRVKTNEASAGGGRRWTPSS